MAIQHAISFSRHAPPVTIFFFKDSTGAAINLTGYTATLRTCPANNPDSTTTTTTPNANITLGGAAGTIAIAWSGLLSGLSEISSYELHVTTGGVSTLVVDGTLFIGQTT